MKLNSTAKAMVAAAKSALEDEGVEFVGVTLSGTSHPRVHFRVGDVESFLGIAATPRNLWREQKNMQGQLRRKIRWIRNPELKPANVIF